jgi:hypothetical protein
VRTDLAPSRPRPLPLIWLFVGIALLGLMLGALVTYVPLGKSRAVCDQAVDTLLNSKDLVEVTRAGFIVHRLECSISQRLP